MPKADFSSWTPLNAVADKIVEWSTGNCEGGLYEVETKQGQTAFNLRK
jgi:dihydropteridine reductase